VLAAMVKRIDPSIATAVITDPASLAETRALLGGSA
jgi:hypothetical protein